MPLSSLVPKTPTSMGPLLPNMETSSTESPETKKRLEWQGKEVLYTTHSSILIENLISDETVPGITDYFNSLHRDHPDCFSRLLLCAVVYCDCKKDYRARDAALKHLDRVVGNTSSASQQFFEALSFEFLRNDGNCSLPDRSKFPPFNELKALPESVWPMFVPFFLKSIETTTEMQEFSFLLLHKLAEFHDEIQDVLGSMVDFLFEKIHRFIVQENVLSFKVKAAAVQAAVSCVLHIVGPETIRSCTFLLEAAVKSLVSICDTEFHEEKEEYAQIVLGGFIKITKNMAGAVEEGMENVFSTVLKILDDDARILETKILGAELLASLAKEIEGCHSIMLRTPRFVYRPLEYIIPMLDEHTQQEKPLEAWNRLSKIFAGFASALGAKELINTCNGPNILNGSLSTQDRFYRQDALKFLSLVARICTEEVKYMLPTIVEPVIALARDEEPSVRLAVVNVMLDFSKCFSPQFQLQYHQTALPALIKALSDFKNPQIQLQATQAMLHFFENCDPKACLPDHLNEAVTLLLKCLEFPYALRKNIKLIVGTLAAIESMASALEDQFQVYYRVVMDYMEGIVRTAKAEPKHEIVALCIKCITKIWLAVGKETVKGDIDKVVQLVLFLQELQLEMGDPVITEVLQAWGRICKCLGHEFKYSMSSAIPFLLEVAQLELFFSGTGYNYSLTKKRMVNKITACYVLSTCAGELLQHFDVWIDEVAPTLNDLVGYSLDDEVAIAAISAMPAILKSSKAAVEKSLQQWYPKSSFELQCYEAVSALGAVLRKGGKFEIRARILNSLDECLEISGTFRMRENKILDLLGTIIENVRAILPGSGDKLLDETYENACKCLTTVMKTWKTSSLKLSVPLFLIMKPIWERDKTENERRKALHIFRLAAEQFGEDVFERLTEISLHLRNACRNKDQPGIPKAVAQAIGIFAEFGGWTFGSLSDDALEALNRVIEDKERLLKNSWLARDAAVSALGKIYLFQRERIQGDPEVVFITWLEQLPILDDAQEARVTHDHLCSAVEVLKKELLKQEHTLTKIFYVYDMILLNGALATEETKARMRNQKNHLKSQLPISSSLRSFP